MTGRSTRVDSRPSFQFYPRDWRTDLALRGCSLAAKGLWIDLLCLMFDSPNRGVLLETTGETMTPGRIAKFVGESESLVVEVLAELESQRVFSRGDDNVIYSRRMVRDAEISRVRAVSGSKGRANSQAKRQQTHKQTGQQEA